MRKVLLFSTSTPTNSTPCRTDGGMTLYAASAVYRLDKIREKFMANLRYAASYIF